MPKSQPCSEFSYSDNIEQALADAFNKRAGDLNEKDGYNCSKCLNRGEFAYIGENGLVARRPCSCMAARKSKRILEKSGLASLVERCRFESYQRREDWQRMAWEQAKHYAAAPAGWFYISGRSGTGKTHLCVAACRELMLAGRGTLYMLWRDEVGKIKFADGDDRSTAIRRFQTVPVLYVDDFLKVGRGEAPTSADISIAFEILNYRYNDPRLITLISSELPLSEVIALDEALGSRIYQKAADGACIQLGNNAGNWRLRDKAI